MFDLTAVVGNANNSWLTWPAIILGTLASEDLTCISSGLLVHRQVLNPWGAIVACFLGIYLGDFGLWMFGRLLGRRMMPQRWLATRLPMDRLEQLGQWFDQRGGSVILASRLLPGTRLPLYVAAGMLGRRAGGFAAWSFVAAALWTPLIVLSVASFGPDLVDPLRIAIGNTGLAIAAASILIYVSIRLVRYACAADGRVRIFKWMHYEFWPAWLFYLPLMPYLLMLSIRYRGFTMITAANPGIPHGGIVGESKSQILSQLPAEFTIPSALIGAGKQPERCDQLIQIMSWNYWHFPLVFKPDASQRGAGVRLIRDLAAAAAYFKSLPGPILVQTYHPGPFEAGIFYYRNPGEETGTIFSITDKVFPVIMGDGRCTLEDLIYSHARFRLQADVFLTRHQDQRARILGAGEQFPLAIAGNHCQGTMFRDGGHLWTPNLERAIDAIAKHFDGFYIGRFDIRYSNLEAFKAGRDTHGLECFVPRESAADTRGVMTQSTAHHILARCTHKIPFKIVSDTSGAPVGQRSRFHTAGKLGDKGIFHVNCHSQVTNQ